MINWILSIFEKSRVRSKSTMPFIVFNTAKKYMQGHLMAIYEILEDKLATCREYKIAYTKLENESNECYYSKDKFGIVTKFVAPLATADLVKHYRIQIFKQTIFKWIFTALEGAFFYMIAEQLAGSLATSISENEKVQNIVLMVISIVFGILCAQLLDKAIEYLLSFLKARVYYAENKIRKEVMQKEYVYLGIASLCAIMFVVALYWMNAARSFALDSKEAVDASVQVGHNPYMGICLIVVSIAVAIYIAIIEMELSELRPRMALYNKWLDIRKEMTKIQKQADKLYTRMENRIRIEYLSVKQMMRDLREILGKECDDRDVELLSEYNAVRMSSLKVDETMYRKYERLVTCMDELVDYGMNADLYANDSYREFKAINQYIHDSQQKIADQLTPPIAASYILEAEEPKGLIDPSNPTEPKSNN